MPDTLDAEIQAHRKRDVKSSRSDKLFTWGLALCAGVFVLSMFQIFDPDGNTRRSADAEKPTANAVEVDHEDYAHAVCLTFEMARAVQCKVIGANKEVRVWINTTPWDAKSMCNTVRKDARKANAMKNWEVYIFPPEGGQSLAGCRV